MEPFSMTQGTAVKVFHLEDENATIVITTTDAEAPGAPEHTTYEHCENADEAQAVVQKWVFDLERQGWQMQD